MKYGYEMYDPSVYENMIKAEGIPYTPRRCHPKTLFKLLQIAKQYGRFRNTQLDIPFFSSTPDEKHWDKMLGVLPQNVEVTTIASVLRNIKWLK